MRCLFGSIFWSGSEIELDEAIECNVFFRRHRRRIPRAIKLGMRDAEYWKLLMKRLIFCFDGTWDPLDARYPTNVVITAESVIPVTYEPVPVSQFIFYDEEVGTETLKWHDHAHSPRSSQIFCISAFGTLRCLGVRDRASPLSGCSVAQSARALTMSRRPNRSSSSILALRWRRYSARTLFVANAGQKVVDRLKEFSVKWSTSPAESLVQKGCRVSSSRPRSK